MSWTLLLLAGLFEVVRAVGFKASDGFRRPGIAFLVVSLVALKLTTGEGAGEVAR